MRVITFASGSRGNCTLVSTAQQHFLIDCGISMRRINENLALSGLKPEDITAIFITHEHADHVCGLSMLCKYYKIPTYAPRTVANHLSASIAGAADYLRVFPVNEAVLFGDAAVSAFHTSHDTDESVGYRIEGDWVFALATDTGCVSAEVFEGLCGADAVIIESNHDVDMLLSGPYPYYLKRRILSDRGHLSNAACAQLALRLCESGTKYIVLGHLSRENNTPRKAFDETNNVLQGRGAMLFVAPEAERLSLELGGDAL